MFEERSYKSAWTEPASMSQQRTMDVLEESTVVDADVHLSIGPDELAGYVDDEYAGRVKSGFAPTTWDPIMGGKIEGRRLTEPEQVEAELVEDFHIDYPLLNTIARIARLSDADLAVAMMRAYNDLIVEKFLDPTDHLGLAVVAPQNPEASAEELDRLADEEQVVGVFIESYAQDPPLGDPSYDVLYEAAEDNGLHVAYHGAAATGFKYDFMTQDQGFREFLEIHTLAHTWQQTMTFTSLLVQGVPEKFPGLNFTFLEAGISWVPYMMWRLNKEYSIRRSEAPLLQKSPEQYARDQFYFATQPLGEPDDPRHLQQVIDVIGADSLMFASDYPHWDFDHPSELGKYLQSTFDPEEREQILEATPAEAFDLDL